MPTSWMLAVLTVGLTVAACDDSGGSAETTPDGGSSDASSTDGSTADGSAPTDAGVDALPIDAGPEADASAADLGIASIPQRPGRLPWTGGPTGRGLPTYEFRGTNVRLRGSLTP
ncbi:MAG: hypothetical protein ACE366_14030 [Bradymonadia bacterium]